MSLNNQEQQLVRGSLQSYVLRMESTRDENERRAMRVKLKCLKARAYAYWASMEATEMLHTAAGSTELADKYSLEASKWLELAEEISSVIHLTA